MSKQLKPMLTTEIVELFNEEELIVIAGGKGLHLPLGLGDLFCNFNGMGCTTNNNVAGCMCEGSGNVGGSHGGGSR